MSVSYTHLDVYKRQPYGQITNETIYLDADEEKEFVIAEANVEVDENGVIQTQEIIARYQGCLLYTSQST